MGLMARKLSRYIFNNTITICAPVIAPLKLKKKLLIYIWGLFVSDPSCSLLMYVTVILLLVKCLRPVILPSMM